jgi:hypothetical protein
VWPNTCVTWHLCDLTLVWPETYTTWHSCNLTLVRPDTCATWHLWDLTLVWPDTCATWHLYDLTLLWPDTFVTWHLCNLIPVRPDTCVTWHLHDLTLAWPDTWVTWHLCDLTRVWPDICETWVPLLQCFQKGVYHFCSLKIDQVLNEPGAMLNTFLAGKLSLVMGILNRDPAIWLTGAIPPTPMSHPILGGSHLHTRTVPPSKSFTIVAQMSGHTSVRSHKCQVTQVSGHPLCRSHKWQVAQISWPPLCESTVCLIGANALAYCAKE